MRTILAPISVAGLLAMLACGSAHALVFSQATFEQYTSAGEQTTDTFLAGTQTATNGAGCARFADCADTATTTITTHPASGVSAYAYSPNISLAGGITRAEATMEFNISVVGSISGYYGIVPIFMIGEVDLSSSATNARASVLITDTQVNGPASGPPPSPTIAVDEACGDGATDCGITKFNAAIVTSYLVSANDDTDIFFDAEAQTFEGETPISHFASAVIDPVFIIDPEFLATHPGFSLVVSQGVGNSAVPEPASWALMMVGVGAIGGAMRRRKLATA